MALITLLYFVFIFVLINLVVQIVLYMIDAKERLVLRMRLSRQVTVPMRRGLPESDSPVADGSVGQRKIARGIDTKP